jgi:hypothetical protein
MLCLLLNTMICILIFIVDVDEVYAMKLLLIEVTITGMPYGMAIPCVQ